MAKRTSRPFSRHHANGSFRWEATVKGATVKVERSCVSFFEAEYGQQAYEEFSAEVPKQEFVSREDLHSVVEEGLGTAALDELLVSLGAPPSGRTPPREAAPQVGPQGQPPPLREEAPARGQGTSPWAWPPRLLRDLRGWSPRVLVVPVAVVLVLWAVTGLPGLELVQDAWGKLAAPEVHVEGTVLGTVSRGLVTIPVQGRGTQAPLRHFEGDVAVRVPGELVVTLTVIAPGAEDLRARLAPYVPGSTVALQCRAEEPGRCRFEAGSTVGATLLGVAELCFGLFLFLLVPGLLALGFRLGRGS